MKTANKLTTHYGLRYNHSTVIGRVSKDADLYSVPVYKREYLLGMTLSEGKLVEIIENGTSYYKIVVSDTVIGYIKKDSVYVSDKEAVLILPTITPFVPPSTPTPGIKTQPISVPEETVSFVEAVSDADAVTSTFPEEIKVEEIANQIINGKTTTSVKVRSTPDSKNGEGNVLKYLNEGTEVKVTGKSGDFYSIEIDETEGYIHSSYIEIMEEKE